MFDILRKIIIVSPHTKGFIHVIDYSVQGLDSRFVFVRGGCKFAPRSKQKRRYGAAWTHSKTADRRAVFLKRNEKRGERNEESTNLQINKSTN
jgi:hypothetical protein